MSIVLLKLAMITRRQLLNHFYFRLSLSIAIGYVAWLHVYLLPLSLLVFYLWYLEANRWRAALLVFVYLLAASHDLPGAGAVFFEGEYSLPEVVGLWLAANTVTIMPFLLFFAKRPRLKVAFLAINVILIGLPPFGLFSVSHPITSAGVLFPDTSLLGAGLLFALVFLFPLYPRISASIAAVAAVIAHGLAGPVLIDASVAAIDTDFKEYSADEDYYAHFERINAIRKIAESKTNKTLLFPESVAGKWTKTQQHYWARKKPAGTVFFGAHKDINESQYQNIIVRMEEGEGEIAYIQRVPLPFAMWNPLADTSATASWWDSGVIPLVGGKQASMLICYEIVLAWPFLIDLLNKPDVIAAFSNTWWAKNTNISYLQVIHLEAYSRLAGIPYYFALNGVNDGV